MSADAPETGSEAPPTSAAEDPDLTKIESLVWEETRSDPTPTHRAPLEREPLSSTRKFMYFLIALSPFIAFVLLLPRGGEDSPAVEEQSPAPPISRQAVPLAFPFESPTPLSDLPSPESVVMESPAAQCSDGVDNDRDGRRDYPADSGCSSSSDNVESSGRRPPAPSPPPAASPLPPSPPAVPSEEPPPPPSPSPSPLPSSGIPDCNDPVDRFFPPCTDNGNNNNNNDDDDDNGDPPADEEPTPDTD